MSRLDPRFFKPFVDGTVRTLKVQCSLDTKLGTFFEKGTRPQPPFSIASVITLSSNVFNGTITLCFPKEVFLKIMEKMLGEPYTEITPEVRDGAGELLNIIFGQAKTVLSDQGYKVDKAIPNVFTGEGIATAVLSSSPVIVIPFVSDVGEFQIEICAEPESK